MNLPTRQAASRQWGDTKAGAVVSVGVTNQAAPAHPVVGCVGFGPAWTVEDSMAASIVRLQCEVEERDARIAVLEEQARILVAERDEARDTVCRLRRERAAQDGVIESLRDQLCADKCRDKAAADGGWGNI